MANDEDIVTFNRLDPETGEWHEVSNDPRFVPGDAEDGATSFAAQLADQEANRARVADEAHAKGVADAIDASKTALENDAPSEEGDNLGLLSIPELKALATDRGVELAGIKKKSQLLTAIRDAASSSDVTGADLANHPGMVLNPGQTGPIIGLASEDAPAEPTDEEDDE